MTADRERAATPEDLARLFVERANADDAEGIAALYEPDAVLGYPVGEVTVGREAIRALFEKVVAMMPPCIVPIGFSIHSFSGNRSSSVCSSALQETNSGSSMSLTRTGRSCPSSAGPQATRKIRSI